MQEVKSSEREVKPVTCNVGGWRVGAVERAVKIAQEMGVQVSTGEELIGKNMQPVIRLHKDSGLSEFWTKLKEEIPNYWEHDNQATS